MYALQLNHLNSRTRGMRTVNSISRNSQITQMEHYPTFHIKNLSADRTDDCNGNFFFLFFLLICLFFFCMKKRCSINYVFTQIIKQNKNKAYLMKSTQSVGSQIVSTGLSNDTNESYLKFQTPNVSQVSVLLVFFSWLYFFMS